MLKTFIEAFKTNHLLFHGECQCGREFHNLDKNAWDYDDADIEYLDSHSFELKHAVRFVEFNGSAYVMDCDCWHGKANRLMNFINSHDIQVGKYLNGERDRKLHEAEQMQLINVLKDTELNKAKGELYDDDIPF